MCSDIDPSISNDSECEIRPELGPEETLLWSGHSRTGIILRRSDAFLIPCSLMAGGFAILIEFYAIADGETIFSMLCGIPFVLFGLYLIFGRFIVDARQRKSTYYAITSERIIITSGFFRRSVKSLNIETLSDVSMSENADGSGMITLGPIHPSYSAVAGTSWPGIELCCPPSMDLADDVRYVYEKIREARREARKNR